MIHVYHKYSSIISLFIMSWIPAVCNENVASSSHECYPIRGYISAYYSGDTIMKNDIAKAVRDIIDSGMSTNTIFTDSLVQVEFIDNRSKEQVNMLMSNTVQAGKKSVTSTIGVFDIVLLLLVAIGLVSLMVKFYRNSKHKAVRSEDMMSYDVENTIKSGYPKDENPLEIYEQNHFNYSRSFASANTQIVSNRQNKPDSNSVFSEEANIEKTVEDAAEETSSSFHLEYFCGDI